jgi:hypothetical protein
LVQERTRETSRVQGVLDRANIKLASVATDIMGVSGRAILAALIEGRANPGTMAELAIGHLRAKIPVLEQALAGLVRDHHRRLLAMQVAHIDFLVVEVRPMIPTVAVRHVNAMLVGLFSAVVAAIDVEARAIEMRKRRGEAQALGSGGGHETIESRDPVRIERVESPSQRIIMEMAGFAPRRDQAMRRFGLKKHRHEVEGLVHKAEPIENHRFDGVAHGHKALFRALLGRSVQPIPDPQFIEHPSPQAEMIQDLTAIDLWHSRLLRRGDATATPKLEAISKPAV